MEASGSFSAATAVRARPDAGGTYDAWIHDGWDIVGNANGGYVLAIAGRALGDRLGRPDPVAVTAHYLAPGTPGPITIATDVVRDGRRYGTGRATLSGAGKDIVTLIGTFGDLAAGPDDRLLVDGAPPDLPPPDDCVAGRSAPPFPPPFVDRVDIRLHPEDAGLFEGRRSGAARIRGWFRLLDEEPVDTTTLLSAVDSFPPTIFNTDLPVGWTPTLELTVHVRSRPEPGWLALDFSTRFVTGGTLEVDGLVWDSSGRLVAQSRQLALVPRG